MLNRKRKSLFGLSMPTKKRKTKLKLSAFLYFVDTDEKATDKLLFPTYLQILLTSKCSNYKYFNTFDIEGGLQIYTEHFKMKNCLKDILSTLEINHEKSFVS